MSTKISKQKWNFFLFFFKHGLSLLWAVVLIRHNTECMYVMGPVQSILYRALPKSGYSIKCVTQPLFSPSPTTLYILNVCTMGLHTFLWVNSCIFADVLLIIYNVTYGELPGWRRVTVKHERCLVTAPPQSAGWRPLLGVLPTFVDGEAAGTS